MGLKAVVVMEKRMYQFGLMCAGVDLACVCVWATTAVSTWGHKVNLMGFEMIKGIGKILPSAT